MTETTTIITIVVPETNLRIPGTLIRDHLPRDDRLTSSQPRPTSPLHPRTDHLEVDPTRLPHPRTEQEVVRPDPYHAYHSPRRPRDRCRPYRQGGNQEKGEPPSGNVQAW